MEHSNLKKLDGDLLLTTACPTECDFCIYSCYPTGEWMPESTIRKVAQEYTKNDVGIRICGGEPFYDLEKLENCLDIVLEYQKPHEVLVITSGFFGHSEEITEKSIKMLTDRKLDTLVVSADRFHQETIPLTSITNIIKEAKKHKLKIILRISTDTQSYGLLDRLAELIVRHNVKYEAFDYGFFGKAELLESGILGDLRKHREYLASRIVENAQKLGRSTNIEDYKGPSSKRSQRKFAPRFFPTTFPNGNVYADSQCTKGTFMGNINQEELKVLLERFRQTLPGHILISENRSCEPIRKLLPHNVEDNCDYCRNQPLVEEMPKEAIGRQFLKIDRNTDIDNLFKNINGNRELLLSVDISEKELGTKNVKLLSFLNKLRESKIRFKISKPIPRCIFGLEYDRIVKDLGMPTNCYHCKELFSVEDLKLRSCKYINKDGPNVYYMFDREQIHEYFKVFWEQMPMSEGCRNCVYFLRKKCGFRCYD